MILVLGATGTTGGEVARQLIAAGERPRLLVRDAAKAAQYAADAEIVTGDTGDPASLAAALRGVEKMYMISAGSALVETEGTVVAAAKAAGVQHVVKLSVVTADAPSITFARWHAASEHKLMESGLRWTMLRPGNFMTNALGWAPTIKGTGEFYQPTGTGRWAAIDPADIGAVAVRALTTSGHDGKAYTLTGPESMDAAGYATILSTVLGKPVRFVDVPPDAAREGMLQSGMPADYVAALLELLAAMKAGFTDGVTSDVKDVLGRDPGTFEAWAQRHRAAFG